MIKNKSSVLAFNNSAFVGIWWLPDNPGEKWRGRLDVEKNSASLMLEEWRPRELRQPTENFPPVHLLHGDANGVPLTLLDAAVSKTVEGSVEFRVFTVVIGVHMESRDDPFQSMDVRLKNLKEWANRQPIVFQEDSWIANSLNASYTSPEDLRADFDSGVSVTLRGWPTFTSSGTAVEIRHVESLVLEAPSGRSLFEFESEYIRPLRQLLALATDYWPRIEYLHASMHDEAGEETMVRIYIEQATDYSQSEDSTTWPYLMTFCLEDLNFSKAIPTWFAIARKGEDFLPAVLEDLGPTYIHSRFLALAAAAQSVHKKVIGGSATVQALDKNDFERIKSQVSPDDQEFLDVLLEVAQTPSYKGQLAQLVHFAGTPFMDHTIANHEEWVVKVTKARHALAHSRSNQPTQSDLFDYSWQLNALLRIIVLRDFGFGETYLLDVAQRHRSKWGL